MSVHMSSIVTRRQQGYVLYGRTTVCSLPQSDSTRVVSRARVCPRIEPIELAKHFYSNIYYYINITCLWKSKGGFLPLAAVSAVKLFVRNRFSYMWDHLQSRVLFVPHAPRAYSTLYSDYSTSYIIICIILEIVQNAYVIRAYDLWSYDLWDLWYKLYNCTNVLWLYLFFVRRPIQVYVCG